MTSTLANVQVGEMIRGARQAAGDADDRCVRMAILAADSARNVEAQQAEIDQVATVTNERAQGADGAFSAGGVIG